MLVEIPKVGKHCTYTCYCGNDACELQNIEVVVANINYLLDEDYIICVQLEKASNSGFLITLYGKEVQKCLSPAGAATTILW